MRAPDLAARTLPAMPAEAKIPSFRPDGSIMDLAAVCPADISFAEMAAGLSKIARFAGRYRCAAYSVAQHSVFCADALYHEHGDALLSGCALLHDGHEYVIGDVIRPTVDLVAETLRAALIQGGSTQREAGRMADAVRAAFAASKAMIDQAIYQAAGIGGYPRLYPEHARQVATMDARMLRAEGLALFGKAAAPHLPAARMPAPMLRAAIEPWGAAKAEIAFLDRLERYLGIVARGA